MITGTAPKKWGKRRVLVVTVIAVNIALLLTNMVWGWQNARIHSQSDRYPLLSKRIFAEKQNDILINFTSLRAALHEYEAKQPQRVSLYFEYLPSGTSIGVNPQVEVRLASLIKVAVVMAAYKQIERGKLSLDTKLTIRKEDLDPRFGTPWKRGAGATLTVREAMRLALVDSDNTASKILVGPLPADALDQVYDSLDMPKEHEDTAVIGTPKNYTSILRSLYLSSYLTREDSSSVLTLLSQAKSNDLLPTGVPDNIVVAHKTGIINEAGTEPIYNDCGIVYVPSRPYALCMMMVGGSEDEAHEQMQAMSKMVYEYVSKAKH